MYELIMKKFSDFYFDIQGELKENYPLASLTWFKVGGPAQLLFSLFELDDCPGKAVWHP